MSSTLIVGGGISGLTLAHQLKRAGKKVTLLEASASPGGKMRSWREKGYLLEAGPNGFLDRDAEARVLARELGIEAQIRPALPVANRRFVFSRGKLHELPLSPPAFLKSSVLPLSARLRLMLEPFSSRGPAEDESVGAFGRRHLGDRATRVLVDAMQQGIWAGDLERLSLRAAFPKMHALENQHRSLILGAIRARKNARRALPAGAVASSGMLATFEGGLQTLGDALIHSLGDALQTEARVSGIEKSAEGWRVTLASGLTHSATSLVLATPTDPTAKLLDAIDPPLAARIRAIPHAPLAVVHLAFPPEVLPPEHIQGFGVLIPSEEKRRVLGVIFCSSSFPFRAPEGHTLLTCMVGGAVRPELASEPDETLVASVRGELRDILGIAEELPTSLLAVIRWPKAIPQYELGHTARIGDIQRAVAHHPGLHLIGSAYQGVGLNDCIRTAREVATRLIEGRAS